MYGSLSMWEIDIATNKRRQMVNASRDTLGARKIHKDKCLLIMVDQGATSWKSFNTS
jgi:hypothetical protein